MLAALTALVDGGALRVLLDEVAAAYRGVETSSVRGAVVVVRDR